MNPHGSFRRKRTKASSGEDYVNDDRNAIPPSLSLAPTIFFSTTAQSDLDQPWFHKLTSRDDAVKQLETSVAGSFIVRPSSQRSCYALSWLDETGVVRHSLIYNHLPGFSLELGGSKKVWSSLTELVLDCPFLKVGLPEKGPNTRKQQSGDDIMDALLLRLQGNDENLVSVSWTLSVLENANNLQLRDQCERRTFISFCHEEFSAPSLFKLDGHLAETVFHALANNSTVKTLILKGHFGFLRVNFTPHLSDAAVGSLCQCLQWNTTLTHLDLSNNAIGNTGAASLAVLLERNHSIRLLNLKNNFIGRDGLLRLAQSLAKNSSLDDVVVGQQFWRGNSFGRELNVSTDSYSRSLVNLIEDCYLRKRELLQPVSAGTTYFHGFLTRDEADHRLASSPNGSFLLYLNKCLPCAIVLCFKTSNMHAGDPAKPYVVLHKALYRVAWGFSFSAPPKSVFTLVESIGWYLKQNSALYSAAESAGLLLDEIRSKMQYVWHLHHLWGLRDVPSPEEAQSSPSDVFTCLQQVISRNRSFLVHPVPVPAVASLSNPSPHSLGQQCTNIT
eukprot:TRINITY_DN1576_c0_g1_i2.p1 TRINITY_DN1576_c0_g1~~TRINITY_DN1576_c0_g1_i2.p1  ORF type:complete len:558 (-),score=43.03 TRINITY_DN1576_c0_g1_i2:1031-2704(-)